MVTRTTLLFVTLFASAGCVSFRPDAGFDEVEALVADRVQNDVASGAGSVDRQSAEESIRSILTRELEEADIVQLVLLNNLELQAKYQELGMAQADVVQAGLASNPTMSLERRFGGRAAEADVAQGFLDAILTPLRRRVAGAAFESTKLKVAEEVLRHALDARLAFYELQASMQTVEVRRLASDSAEAAASAVRSLRAAGNAREIDLRREEVSAAEAKLELATAEGEVAQRREALHRLMGLWGRNTGWKTAGRLPEPPADDAIPDNLESIAVESRLDLQSARKELEGLAESVGIAQITSLIPDLILTGHFEREPSGGGTTGPSLTLPLPIFNWGRAAAGQAEARFTQAERRYTALAIDIRSQVRSAYARMKVARAKAAYYRSHVMPLLDRSLSETQLLYNGMFVGVSDLLKVKRDQADAAAKYVEALRDYWSARTDLEAALGRTIPLQPTPAMETLPQAAEGASHHHQPMH